jgi:hypothetical protein
MARSRRLRAAAAFACVAVAALTAAALEDCPLKTESGRASATTGLTAAFQQEGFDVTEGAMWFFKFSDLDESCEDCYFANPTSSYGCPLLVRPSLPSSVC